MRGTSSLSIGLILLVAASAFAEEQIFYLRDGKKVRGEVVERLETKVVVRTASGERIELARSNILLMEKAKGKSPTSSGTPSKVPGPAKPKPNPPARVYSGAPPAVVAECRAWMKRSLADRAEDREVDLDYGARKFGLAAFVTVLVQVPSWEENRPERDLARDIVKRAGEDGRAVLIDAVLGTDDSTSPLFSLLDEVFDEKTEAALADKLLEMRTDTQAAAVELLGRRGGHRSLDGMTKLALSIRDDTPSLVESVGRALGAIVAREPSPDDVLSSLARAVAKMTFPRSYGYEAVLIPLGKLTLADDARPALLRIHGTLSKERAEEPEASARRDRLTSLLVQTYRSLAAIGGSESIETIEKAVDEEKEPAHRHEFLRCLADAQSSGRDAELVKWLLALWEKDGADEKPVIQVLQSITGKSYGRAVGAWRSYLREITPR